MAETREYLPASKGLATTAIHAFQDPDQWNSKAVVAPMIASSTFKVYETTDEKFIYSRDDNPTREILENTLASLENGKYGLCFSSGLGTAATVTNLFKSGDHIICGEQIYEGVSSQLNESCAKFGLEVTYVAQAQDKIEEAIKPNTKLIWLETLTNPTLQVADIQATADIARKHKIILGVDNTFVSPYFMQPLDLGADIVMHSITKYINGHSDVIMGCLITNNKELYDKLKFLQKTLGIVPAPFDCYQVTRSLKTLAVRMQQHMKSSLAVAKFLENHPKVEKVVHPGLPSHPQHELYKKQASGCSGMLSFYVKGGEKEAITFFKSVKVFIMAVSLGGVESLVQIPYLMSHGPLADDVKLKLGISPNLIRLSIGLEDTEDLLEDLEQALAKL